MLQEVKKPWFMKTDPQLEELMTKLERDASNNYKDNARKWYKQLEDLWSATESEGRLTEKQHGYYEARMQYYRKQMEGYHH